MGDRDAVCGRTEQGNEQENEQDEDRPGPTVSNPRDALRDTDRVSLTSLERRQEQRERSFHGWHTTQCRQKEGGVYYCTAKASVRFAYAAASAYARATMQLLSLAGHLLDVAQAAWHLLRTREWHARETPRRRCAPSRS